MTRHITNAIVSSIHDGWDIDGHWVETQLVSLLSIDTMTVRATFQRYVRNLQAPANVPHATFVRVGEGTLKRVSQE